MPLSKLRPTFTFTEERLRELQQVVPEAFADGKINWDVLREALGEYLEDETQEHFGLSWPGKREARRLAALPPQGALLPQPGLGVNEETTHNLFIEADNLEALKLLLKAYAGRVKMIYIDPPYNTGNDFVYPDDYSQPLEAYLRQTGQADEQGRRLTTNTSVSGRYHSNWLNMMYPRLLLAHQLLSDDGIIFISIDDNEFHNLRQLVNEIFGEENFLATIIWHKVYSPRMDAIGFSVFHDYILCFGKSDSAIPQRLSFIQNEAQFSYIDSITGNKYRRRSIRKEGMNSLREDAPTAFFPLEAPDGTLVFPIKPNGIEGCWRWSRKKYEMEQEAGHVEWVQTERGWEVYAKQFLSDSATKPPVTLWSHKEVGHTHEASDEIAKLLGSRIFDSPKPTRLIKKILQINTTSDGADIVLDFFSGSATTSQAVLEMNREDDGNRQFIMVQLPEPTPPESVARKAGYATIADIGRERIRRVIQRMQKEQPTLTGGSADLGFRSYKLGRSHFTPWQPQSAAQPEQLVLQLDTAADPLLPGWQPADLLPEILLIEGFPLDSRVRPLPAYPANQVVEVSHDFCAHRLTICLDATLAPSTLAALQQLRPEDTLICLDSALDDESKLRLADRCNLKVI